MGTVQNELLNGIPCYERFRTADELASLEHALVDRSEGAAELLELGRSRDGRALRCLKVGKGPSSVLALGAPHPNEPVGTMTLSYLAERLADRPELADELGCTFYLVFAWDIDGLVLNEGWLGGPFDLYHYARHYFRPPFIDQPDWTFPTRHKRLRFDALTPEAACVRNLIDEVHPDMLLSLHNCSFGGAYWYESHPTPQIWDALRLVAQKNDVPLNLSTPEMPYAHQLAPAVFACLGAEDAYDYYESLGAERPEEHVPAGTTSACYARDRYGTFGLVCEIPYFTDSAISDGSGSGRSLRSVTLERLDRVEECDRDVKSWMSALAGVVGVESPYYRALSIASFAASDAALRQQALSDSRFEREASVAEAFEALVVRPYYRMRNVGMVLGAIDYARKTKRLTVEECASAKRVAREAEEYLRLSCEEFEVRANYRVIPIRNLVATQLESLLLSLDLLGGQRAIH